MKVRGWLTCLFTCLLSIAVQAQGGAAPFKLPTQEGSFHRIAIGGGAPDLWVRIRQLRHSDNDYRLTLEVIQDTAAPPHMLWAGIHSAVPFSQGDSPSNSSLLVNDLNFDGYNDIVIVVDETGGPTACYDWWTYHPGLHTFSTDQFSPTLCNIAVYPEARLLHCSGILPSGKSDLGFEEIYQWQDGSPVLVQDLLTTPALTYTWRVSRKGKPRKAGSFSDEELQAMTGDGVLQGMFAHLPWRQFCR